jgi:hypothetical protein
VPYEDLQIKETGIKILPSFFKSGGGKYGK